MAKDNCCFFWYSLLYHLILSTIYVVMNMKKFLVVVLKTFVIVSLFLVGIFVIHFLFIMGVEYSKEKVVYDQCVSYAEKHQVPLVKVLNGFTYQGNTNYAACVVTDLYEKIMFVDENLNTVVERNYRSYVEIDAFDPQDKQQSYTVSLYQDKPVYVLKKVNKESLMISYYSFDDTQLLFELDSEE